MNWQKLFQKSYVTTEPTCAVIPFEFSAITKEENIFELPTLTNETSFIVYAKQSQASFKVKKNNERF